MYIKSLCYSNKFDGALIKQLFPPPGSWKALEGVLTNENVNVFLVLRWVIVIVAGLIKVGIFNLLKSCHSTVVMNTDL